MRKTTLYLLIALAVITTACDTKKETATVAIVEYPILVLSSQKTVLQLEYPTTLEGIETVEIRSKIDGYIEAVYIEEGSMVKTGQKLFKIDADRFIQEVNQRKAAVKAVEAALETASIQVIRTGALVDKKIVNAFELTTAKNLERVKRAELQQAQAALTDAQSQLAFTQITSPITGIVGRLPFKKGSLVNSTSEQALTTIANTQEMFAHFSLSQKQLNLFIDQYPGNSRDEKIKNMPQLSLTQANGENYPLLGKIQNLSGILNEQTGSANFKALFPNPDGILWSGASATLHIPTIINQAIRIPKKAVFEIQGKFFAYMVDSQNTVHATEIDLLPTALEREFVVRKGLKAGDAVVIDGIESLRNGIKIQPSPISHK